MMPALGLIGYATLSAAFRKGPARAFELFAVFAALYLALTATVFLVDKDDYLPFILTRTAPTY